MVISICSPLTSKAQGTVEAETNSLPEWRWEAVIAALEDPSIEVQQAAVEWLAVLSEQRYAPPQGATSKRLCELLKARLVPANTDAFYVLRALPWVDPTCTGAAPQMADLLTNSDEGLREAAAETLGSMGLAAANVASQVTDLLKGSDDGIRKSAAYALKRMGPAAASVAPQVADLLKAPMRGSVGLLPKRLEAWAPQQRVLSRRWPTC